MKHKIINFLKFKRIITVAAYLVTGLSLFSQPGKQLVIGQQPVYKVSRAREPIIVDGKMDEASWKNAEIQSFNYFYRIDKPIEKQNSKFRILWDDANLYLFYECEDTSLTARETSFDARPYLDDCAEFFCVPVPDSLYMHFGFEINITKAAYDYIVLWRYYNNQTIFIRDYNPEYKVAVTYDGTINNDKDKDKMWQMEFSIPFIVFSDFHFISRPKAGVRWAFQAVRQDRNYEEDSYRSTSTLFPIYDMRKAVHQPARFGLLEFTDD